MGPWLSRAGATSGRVVGVWQPASQGTHALVRRRWPPTHCGTLVAVVGLTARGDCAGGLTAPNCSTATGFGAVLGKQLEGDALVTAGRSVWEIGKRGRRKRRRAFLFLFLFIFLFLSYFLPFLFPSFLFSRACKPVRPSQSPNQGRGLHVRKLGALYPYILGTTYIAVGMLQYRLYGGNGAAKMPRKNRSGWLILAMGKRPPFLRHFSQPFQLFSVLRCCMT
ncbi:hypothetical protein B0T26DRAFT_522781 [Lasiosphaeria miniovina]|uniref:Uncharacterized protein n=1 Tax=Lasiosphaeria miniovina TaxID=1954250 RepID=A0AA39ZV04_9PEZI|nr:uncharacterized protein B0T26DRAFT_522781 [Lasiosphaeria miniovina]KAK0704067.1 hypothetical protein B0T26DRAFT_522781 [Lasiosphaeria miniovina]